MTRETTYRKEFHDTVSNWNQNRVPAAVLILGLMMVMFGGCCIPSDNPPGKSCNDCGHQW